MRARRPRARAKKIHQPSKDIIKARYENKRGRAVHQ
jgi:hypothetical protein